MGIWATSTTIPNACIRSTTFRPACVRPARAVGSVQFVTRDCVGHDPKAYYVPLDAEHAISVAAAKRIFDARAICLRNKSV